VEKMGYVFEEQAKKIMEYARENGLPRHLVEAVPHFIGYIPKLGEMPGREYIMAESAKVLFNIRKILLSKNGTLEKIMAETKKSLICINRTIQEGHMPTGAPAAYSRQARQHIEELLGAIRYL